MDLKEINGHKILHMPDHFSSAAVIKSKHKEKKIKKTFSVELFYLVLQIKYSQILENSIMNF